MKPFLRTRPQIGLNLADFGSICGLVRRNVAYAGRWSLVSIKISKGNKSFEACGLKTATRPVHG